MKKAPKIPLKLIPVKKKAAKRAAPSRKVLRIDQLAKMSTDDIKTFSLSERHLKAYRQWERRIKKEDPATLIAELKGMGFNTAKVAKHLEAIVSEMRAFKKAYPDDAMLIYHIIDLFWGEMAKDRSILDDDEQ